MTDPLESYDVDLLKRYDAEVQEIETLPPAAIELSPRQALAPIAHIQIGAANPGVKHNPLLRDAMPVPSKFKVPSIQKALFTKCWNSAGRSVRKLLHLTKFSQASKKDNKD